VKPLKPEKIVELEVLEACKQLGFSVSVIDSKATYSKNLGRYSQSRSAPEGFPDLVGCTPNGVLAAIELKARGKLRTIRPKQVDFLQKKIEMNCFAVCVDSADLLFDLYLQWKQRGREVLQEHLSSLC
jgi:hypothetical protein